LEINGSFCNWQIMFRVSAQIGVGG